MSRVRTRRRSFATAAVAGCLLVTLSAQPALADRIGGRVGAGGGLGAELSRGSSLAGTDPARSTRRGSERRPRPIWVAQPVLATGDPDRNDGICRGWRYVRARSSEHAATLRHEGRAHYEELWDALLRTEAPDARADVDCPGEPGGGVPAVAVRDNVRGVVTGQLPRPRPSVPPGHALTGLPAYLDTGDAHELTYQQTETVEVGAVSFRVEISASAESTVDWGDGSPPVTYDRPGRPHPDGEVHHTYRERGEVTITVTDRWTIDFTATTSSGVSVTDTVTATLDAVVLDDLEVRGYRAVRTRPD